MYFVAFIVYINHRFLDSWGPTGLVPPAGVKHMTPYPKFQSIKKLLELIYIISIINFYISIYNIYMMPGGREHWTVNYTGT